MEYREGPARRHSFDIRFIAQNIERYFKLEKYNDRQYLFVWLALFMGGWTDRGQRDGFQRRTGGIANSFRTKGRGRHGDDRAGGGNERRDRGRRWRFLKAPELQQIIPMVCLVVGVVLVLIAYHYGKLGEEEYD